MADMDFTMNVQFRDSETEGICLADVTLPESGIQVTGIRVSRDPGGAVSVSMPLWMHTRWTYAEVSWAEVRQTVAQRYAAVRGNGESVPKPDTPPAEKKTPSFSFYSRQTQDDTTLDIVLKNSGERICGFRVVSAQDGRHWVYVPGTMGFVWNRTDIAWEEVRQQIIHAFENRGDGASFEEPSLTVLFGKTIQVTSYLVDVEFPHKLNTVKGFRLKVSDTIRVSPPSWMGRWKDTIYPWGVVCKLLTEAYHDQFDPKKEPKKSDAGREEPKDESKAKNSGKEKNEYGRIKNADNSSLRFYPRTVLRLAEKEEDGLPKRNLIDLVNALSRGSKGGFGPFEVNILDWVDRLKYVSSTMLLDLIRGGQVSIGWREDMTQSKLTKIISRMNQYDLVAVTRFVEVDDDGIPSGDSHSLLRVLTLGRGGSTLLHELGKNTTRYNAFNIYQDGNTVKRYLCANQWLVYWLTTFPDAVSDNYETSAVVYQKGSDFSGARIYASVTCNDCSMVAEPLRRVETFEYESNKAWLRHKFNRYLSLFTHLDELYAGQEEITFAGRPVLVYLCEDEEHIEEIREQIGDLMQAHPEQEVWFTTDLRIFNYDQKGQRFLRFDGEGMHTVNLTERLGVTE